MNGAGFTKVVSLVEGLEDFAGYQVRIQAKNENYVAEKVCPNDTTEILACTPDLISIVDSGTGKYTYMFRVHVHTCVYMHVCTYMCVVFQVLQ